MTQQRDIAISIRVARVSIYISILLFNRDVYVIVVHARKVQVVLLHL